MSFTKNYVFLAKIAFAKMGFPKITALKMTFGKITL